jgi:DNA-binding NarL/FixJ family response regulator
MALVRVLREDFNIVGVVADGATLIAHAIQLQPDAIVADVHLQTLDGITATIDIRRRDPAIPIVLVTGDDDPSLRSRAIAAGASAFVRKLAGADSLVAVLQDLLR